MIEPEPEYLCKFHSTLTAALNKLPSDADMITVLVDALVKARADIYTYQIRHQMLEFETKNLRRELKRLKETVSNALV